MTNQNDPKSNVDLAILPSDITDAELDAASGGFNPQPDPPKVRSPLNPVLPPKLIGGLQQP